MKYAKSYSKVIALYMSACMGRLLKRCCIYHGIDVLNTQSRVYVAIGFTDVKDYTSNNITWDLSLRLRTDPTQNKYSKIVVSKLTLLIEANHRDRQSIERRIFIS